MGIFGKNPNEAAYTGGKKHWADVIKNSGNGELLIWKQPEEDFNTNSTLIVMPGEEAIFIKDGHVESVSESGKYNLKTDNYPFISRIRNAFTGGISVFNCVVYFVRKAHSAEITWGTPTPMQVRDPLLGMMTNVQANGSFKVQVENSVKFLEKLLGNNVFFETQAGLNKYFFNEFIQHITDSIQDAIENSDEEITRTFKKKGFLADDVLTPILQEILDDYGLRLVKFTIATLQFVNDELRRMYEERTLQMNLDAREKLVNAQADKSVFGVLGEDWNRQQAVNIFSDLANNPGGGGIAAAGAGLGMGMAAGGAFGGMAQQIFNPAQPQASGQAAQGATNQGQTPASNENPVEKIKQLKEMLDMGVITQQEFDAKKQEILRRM